MIGGKLSHWQAAVLSSPWKIRVTSQSQYHRGCNMKRVRVDERPGITLFTFYNWGRALSRGSANRSNGLLKPAHQKRQEDTTDEFRLERNSCLVLNFSTCVPSVTNIVQQNLIQEQTASLKASSTPLISVPLWLGRHRRRQKKASWSTTRRDRWSMPREKMTVKKCVACALHTSSSWA